MTEERKEQILIYQAPDGAIELRSDANTDTIWASQEQIALLFNVERSVVTKHIRNLFKDGELEAKSVCAKFAHTAQDGKIYQVQFYNLDVILSVGYRTNSRQAVQFRKWSTTVLRDIITKGFSINRSRISENYSAFLRSVEDIKALLPKDTVVDNEDILELISAFAETWLSLDAYDRDALMAEGMAKESVTVTSEELEKTLGEFRLTLIQKGEASELFGTERVPGSLSGIVGNIFQSFGGEDLYPSIEEKAAHLLYFIIKNHPFADGNKRSGAYAFIWFLSRTHTLDTKRLTPPTLTTLTLLIAESDPKDKERMVKLVLQILKKT